MTDLKGHPVFYVARDRERAQGLALPREGYSIISNKPGELLDTDQLLELEETDREISAVPGASVLVFKNTSRIEAICGEKGWRLLNPSAALSKTVEEKVSQVEWLGELGELLPQHRVLPCKAIRFEEAFGGEPFILQFNHAHTGQGTFLIRSAADLEPMARRFPERPARITRFVDGPVFTSNNVAAADRVLVGNISYQITGLAPLSDNPFATVGNDWELPLSLLDERQRAEFSRMAERVGARMAAAGWRGLFGIDAVLDQKTGSLYLLEINARQPASTSYESELQRAENPDATDATSFEAHLAALLGEPLPERLAPLRSGAQLVKRVRSGRGAKHSRAALERAAAALSALGYRVFLYDNDAPGSDLIRVQSHSSFMAGHGTLNARGKEVASLLESLDA